MQTLASSWAAPTGGLGQRNLPSTWPSVPKVPFLGTVPHVHALRGQCWPSSHALPDLRCRLFQLSLRQVNTSCEVIGPVLCPVLRRSTHALVTFLDIPPRLPGKTAGPCRQGREALQLSPGPDTSLLRVRRLALPPGPQVHSCLQ